MTVLGLEAAMEVMERAATCLLIIHLLVHLACTCTVRAACQYLEIVLMLGEELGTNLGMGLVQVHRVQILLPYPLVPAHLNLLHQIPIVRFQLVLLDILDLHLLQEEPLMDHL